MAAINNRCFTRNLLIRKILANEDTEQDLSGDLARVNRDLARSVAIFRYEVSRHELFRSRLIGTSYSRLTPVQGNTITRVDKMEEASRNTTDEF